MSDTSIELEKLMKVNEITSMTTDEALDIAGRLIDLSSDELNIEGIKKAFSLLEQIEARKLSLSQAARFHYFWANAWSDLRYMTRSDPEETWAWEQEEIAQEIVHLRRAVDFSREQELPRELMCSIFTNLGNIMSFIGRIVEAIDYWNRALSHCTNFGMALGNRAAGLVHYAVHVHDRHDAIRLIEKAEYDLNAALLSTDIHEAAAEDFRKYYSHASDFNRLNRSNNHVITSPADFGNSAEEIAYRRWCAEHLLFLNHLCEISIDVDVSEDNLLLPPMIRPIEESPKLHGLFNQLKQEYVSARYFLYLGVTTRKLHFADRRVSLYNTFDYAIYSHSLEQIKASFRIFYSIFDKIAFFLNAYLKLPIEKRPVSFRTIWYVSQDRTKGLRQEFVAHPNWPLRGLFWLSKDFLENKEGFRETLEPAAQKLAAIRNHLEHKYLKTHEWGAPSPPQDGYADFSFDDLAFSIGRSELEEKALKIASLARSALIYLIMAIHANEQKLAEERKDLIIPEVPIVLLDDESKF